jgi:hypothetical protein
VARDVVLFSRRERSTLRSQIDLRGRTSLHQGAGVRIAVGASGGTLAEQLRELGLDRGRRPLACVAARGLRARIGAGVTLPGE